MMPKLFLALPLSVAMAVAVPAGAQQPIVHPVAVLQGLDKITARISTFEAPVDETVTFGSLEIIARTCQETPPEEAPESAAFLEIDDQRPDGPRERVFQGWMFASSPALSAMEHPVYDVWVVDCRDVARAAGDEEEAPDQAEPSGQ